MRNPIKRPDGYVEVYRPDIANTKSAYMPEHRAVWIDHYGDIPDGAVIHHRNGVKDDNHTSNLEMYLSNGAHMHDHLIDLWWLEPDHSRLKPFDLVDMMFVRSHLPLDRLAT